MFKEKEKNKAIPSFLCNNLQMIVNTKRCLQF